MKAVIRQFLSHACGTVEKDSHRNVNGAREIGHAATLMYALWFTSWLDMYDRLLKATRSAFSP
jgi:hypothetical protein